MERCLLMTIADVGEREGSSAVLGSADGLMTDGVSTWMTNFPGWKPKTAEKAK